MSLEEAGRLGRFFSIKKSYFLQVKSIILVGTLEKYQFFILMIPKVFLICGLVMELSVSFPLALDEFLCCFSIGSFSGNGLRNRPGIGFY
ncbi:hypothetical protein BUQ74_07225 [Leptospira weilii serovar Heyan]|nr:hypothetical protein BUQ74_07225 [Leptospira weilii serovar Heyan]